MIASPGTGRQHFAYWIATPSTPRNVNAVNFAPGAVDGADVSSGLPGWRVSACATTKESRLPRPMSARMSSCVLEPYSFCSASQRSHVIDSGSKPDEDDGGAQPHDAGHAFVTRVLGPAGQKILLRDGFLPRKKP